MPRHKFTAKYLYPPMKHATSYQKLLTKRLEELKLLGAILEIKEYDGSNGQRQPKAILPTDLELYTNPELKDLESVLVVIKSPGRTGKLLASTYVTRDFYYGTVRAADRAGADDIQCAVASLLEHIEEFVARKTSKPKTA